MKAPLPLGAGVIGEEWMIEEGGFGITAETDAAGRGIIGIYPLNKQGIPSGHRALFDYERLLIRLVIGFDANHKAIVVFADVELTSWGMFLRVLVPPHLMERQLERHLSVKWGSPLPEFYHPPANANWPDVPTIRKI